MGDRAKFTFPPQKSYWVFAAEQLIREKLVVLKCVEAFHIHEGQAINTEQEWLDTRLIWRITQHPEGSTIHFTHDGLLPTLSCYQVCEQGWDHFFVNSLQLYLNTGHGTPHKVET